MFGVDIGGTTVKLGLFSEAGAIVEKWEIVTRTENEGAAILPDVAEAINGKLEQHSIEKEQVRKAFLPHATSKIRSASDLETVVSLGFRGEALSSIASVAKVELVTKTDEGISGIRYVIEGGEEKSYDEIGCPEGTTFIIRNLFFNTPARRKFLKSKMTEAGYVESFIQRLALSHPDISFKFICDNKNKISTSGNGNLKDVIYNIFGRDVAMNLLPVKGNENGILVDGYIGKPVISRGNRNYENYL